MSAALLVAAVQARRDSEESGGGDLGRLAGITGQRQEIAFRVTEDGRPQALATLLWAQCLGVREQRTAWTPAASGLAFGLRSCTSNGPTGAPKS